MAGRPEELLDGAVSPSTTYDLATGYGWPSLGTLQRKHESEEEKEERLKRMADAVRTLLECCGEDPNREGLIKTPERYAKALLFFTKGYEESIPGTVACGC